MVSKALLLVFISALLTAVANLALRGGVLGAGGLSLSPNLFLVQMGALLKQPLFVIGVLFYGIAAIVWFAALSLENLTTSYPILVGMTFVMVGLGAVVFYGEFISAQKLAGIATILLGIALVARA